MAKKFQSLIDRVIKLQTSGVQAPDKATQEAWEARIRDRRPTRWPDMALKEMSPSTPAR